MRLPETRKGRLRLAIVAGLAFGTFYFLLSRVIPHDDLQGLLEDISDTLGRLDLPARRGLRVS